MIVKESSPTERFEIAFNQMHQRLKELVRPRRGEAFIELLHEAKKHHAVVRHHFSLLKQFAKLRNAIVHEKIKASYYIAEPHIEIVEEIEQISELLSRPPLALSVASTPVLSFSSEDHPRKILKAIEQYSYSQFPIYQGREFKGLVTEGGMAKWFSQHILDDVISIKSVNMQNILEVEKPHNVAFLKKKATIFDLEEIYETSFDNKKKLEAVLITHSGSQNEKPMGIITSWDLIQIDHNTVTLSSHQ